ncbi:protein LTO1 homolog [Phlebotomus argentipes]|uniref:protein LTO1 homolog n=1 Tax=Phlebotomus argentipes TaxID=94469 RepID=UPI0028930DDD|nr:protein LTO1 homolog [Phlebotomus argentipes]
MDINDVFDNIALAEDKLTQQGYEEGFAKGAAAGNTEAYHLGYHRGAEFGAELGYYTAVEEISRSDCKGQKSEHALDVLREMLEKFPKSNDATVDFVEEMLKIRAQFRKVCVLLKIKNAFSTESKLSF